MYSEKSPWYKTNVVKGIFLDVLNKRHLYKDPFDEQYTIEPKYERRPDLLSYDRYGSTKWWWVFADRNPNTLIDPINDFTAGTTIYVPKSENIKKMK